MRDRIKRTKYKEKHQKRIRDVIKGLSRKVNVFKQPTRIECPNCYYDKLTLSSTGKCKWTVLEAPQKQTEYEVATGATDIQYKFFVRGRCPICLGEGAQETDRNQWVDCLVTWDPDARGFGNNLTLTPAGTEGSTVVALKTHPKHLNLFKNCKRIIVDGVECKLSKPPVERGLGKQALLIISAFTTEKPDLDTNEIVKDYT